MTGDGVLAVVLAGGCLMAGICFVARCATRGALVLSSAAHAVMAVGMAAMFVPAVDPVPRPVWAGLFLLLGAWFGAAAIREGSLLGEPGNHVVGAVAMLFMLASHGGPEASAAAATGEAEHAHHGVGSAVAGAGLATTVVALALAAWFLTDIVRRLTATRPGRASGAAAPANSRAALLSAAPTAPFVLMSGAMAIMLLGMA